ncbi:hypothetical protein ACPV5O_21165 [Vibrio maritimus]|uniref:hypothetical protein n=1 Tax=Vibrio maritimus TaxID=990268 RepID=UPI00406817A1
MDSLTTTKALACFTIVQLSILVVVLVTLHYFEVYWLRDSLIKMSPVSTCLAMLPYTQNSLPPLVGAIAGVLIGAIVFVSHLILIASLNLQDGVDVKDGLQAWVIVLSATGAATFCARLYYPFFTILRLRFRF